MGIWPSLNKLKCPYHSIQRRNASAWTLFTCLHLKLVYAAESINRIANFRSIYFLHWVWKVGQNNLSNNLLQTPSTFFFWKIFLKIFETIFIFSSAKLHLPLRTNPKAYSLQNWASRLHWNKAVSRILGTHSSTRMWIMDANTHSF